MITVVDLQGFHIQNGGYQIKELVIFKGCQSNYFLFKPKIPFTFLDSRDRVIVYHSEEYHGLKYEKGYVDYDLLNDILKTNFIDSEIIYLRGRMKCTFLNGKFQELDITAPKIVNIENFDSKSRWPDCPKIQKATPLCLNHSNREGVCALNNCQAIKNWVYDCIPI